MAAPAPRKSQALETWPAVTAFKPLYDEVQRSFETFLNGWPDAFRQNGPLVKLDCVEDAHSIEVTAELPGLTEKDVTVELAGNVLTISGVKSQESERKDKGVTVSERSYGAFSRTIALPSDVDTTKIEASVADGVLKVIAPRKAGAPPKKIAVKAKE
jgi:HSP20 family protein